MKKRNSFAILTIAGAAVLSLASCEQAKPEPKPDPGHQHSYSELHAQVNPTCLSEGQKAYYTCTGCDLLFNENKEVISQIESIPTLPHTPHHHDATDPSCTEPGTGEYWTCDNTGDDKLYGDKDCKEVIQSIPVVDPKGHKLSHMDGNPASCKEVGWKEYYKCDDCDALFEDAEGKTSIADLEAWKKGAGKIDLAPHVAEEVKGQASTCKEHGWKDYYHCDVCGKDFEDAEATKVIADLAAWKLGDGQLDYAAHTLEKQNGQSATCTSDGWKDYYKCSVCDRLFEDAEAATEITDLAAWKVGAGKLPMGAHGHTLCAGEESSCKEHGYADAYYCEGCQQYFENEATTMLIGNAEAYEAWKVGDGQLPFAAHKVDKQDGQASSCTEHGWADYYKCSVCDRMFEEEACENEITNFDEWKVGDGQLPLAAHETSKVDGQAATCEDDGWKDYYQCSECKGFFEDEAGETPIADLAAWKIGDGKIPAKGHDKDLTKTEAVAPTCYQTGVKEYYKCESCGKYFEDASAEDEIADLAAWKAGAGLVPATGDHDFDYSNVEVSWDGINATAVAKCLTEGCVETVSETKEGSYVKDTDATCTAPEKGHYEVTFSNTNLGSARTAANSVDNGEPHAHTYGDLIPQVDANRENAGMKAHYQCSECSGYFDSDKNAVSESSLVIPAPARHFAANTDMNFDFDEPIAITETITVDVKLINPTSSSKVNFALFGEKEGGGSDWSNYFGYFAVRQNGVDSYAGITMETVTDDGYFRIKIDLSQVNRVGNENGKTPSFTAINGLYVRGGWTDVEGSIEVNSEVEAHHICENLIQESDTYRDGMVPHYECEECGQLFDSNKVLSTKEALLKSNVRSYAPPASGSTFAEFAIDSLSMDKELVFDIKFDNPTKHQEVGMNFYCGAWHNYFGKYWIDCDESGAYFEGDYNGMYLEELHDGWYRITADLDRLDKVVVEEQYTDEGVPTYVDYVYFSAPNTVDNRGSGLIEMQPTKVAHNYGDLIEGDFYHGSGDHISYYQCDVCEQYFDANKHPISSSDISVNKNVLNVVGGSSEEAFAYNIGSQETVYMDVKIDDPTKAMYIGFRSTAKGWQRTDNVKIYADGRFEYTDTVGAKLKQGFSMLGKTADGYLRCKFDLSKMDKEDGFVTVSHILLYKWEHSSGTIEINQRKSEMLTVLSGQFEYGTGFDFNPINKDSGKLIFDIEYTGLAETKAVWFSLFDTSESWDHYLRYGILNDGTTSNKYTGVTTEVLETNKVRVTIDLAAACASGDVTGSPVNFNKLNFHSSWGWGGPGQITFYFLEK